MNVWYDRSIEERNLLNPAFCTIVLWHLIKGFQTELALKGEENSGLPLQLSYIGLSFVLRGVTRKQLPRSVATTLTAWLHSHPLERSSIAKGVIVLRPFIREALIFGVQHKAISFNGVSLLAGEKYLKEISKYLRLTSTEVNECAKSALFVGRWLQKAGSVSTIMALLGVRT